MKNPEDIKNKMVCCRIPNCIYEDREKAYQAMRNDNTNLSKEVEKIMKRYIKRYEETVGD